LAVFGAPERLSDHADRAVAATHDVADALVERFGPEPIRSNPEPIRFGIGVNSGRVVVGSVGGGGRLEFAVIGDPVNVAARVERLTRDTGDVVLHRGHALPALGRRFPARAAREFALKGVSEPVPIYALRLSLDKSSSSVPKASQAQA
jgi:adenylate cyclase